MDDGLKQRLIGAIVLVTVTVIFIPMMLDDEAIAPERIMVPLPPRPVLEKSEIAPPIRPEIAVSYMVGPDDDSTSKGDVQASSVDPKEGATPAAGWVIQMGAFKEQKNANNLRDKLRAAKYKTYIQHRPDGTAALYRVYVGPEIQWADIESLRNELLKQDYQLDEIKIVRYLPGLSS